MKVGVIVFPGSNCDEDAVSAFRDHFGCETVKLWHKEHDLQACDLIFLPGGFSYGDYLRSGAIARFSPIMQNVMDYASKGGLVWGVCNGFQILCESQLLPGALLHNNHQKFNCKNVFIKPQTNDAVITSQLQLNRPLQIPIAHGEGRYFCNEETLNSLIANDQILFKYCDENGQETVESNPNGSLLNIAGVCNIKRNVFGMMPHPERAVDSQLYNTDGQGMFRSLISAFEHIAL